MAVSAKGFKSATAVIDFLCGAEKNAFSSTALEHQWIDIEMYACLLINLYVCLLITIYIIAIFQIFLTYKKEEDESKDWQD